MPVLVIEGRRLDAPDGSDAMRVSRAAGYPLAGECEGSLACATCHVVVDPGWIDRLPPPSDDEEAMLDAVFNLTATSRLACQIRLGPDTDGIVLSLPR